MGSGHVGHEVEVKWTNHGDGELRLLRRHQDDRSKQDGALTFLTLIPAFLSPIACLFLNSVTIEIGFKPAFSASVVGITSRASAYAWKQYASFPFRV